MASWEAMKDLLGRRIEVFWPEEEAWFAGLVAQQGTDPDAALGKADGEEGVGWLVRYDDGDTAWLRQLRGTAHVRFLGDDSCLSPEERQTGSWASPAAVEGDGGGPESPHLAGSSFRGGGSGSFRCDPRSQNASDAPRFAHDTICSTLPDYVNVEADRVKECFHAMNFHTIGKLPQRLEPDAVVASQRQHLQTNLSQGSK